MQPEIWVQSDLFFSFRYSSKHIENGKINTFHSRKATESKVNSGSASGNDKITSSSVLSTQRITSCARDIWEAKRDVHPGSSLSWMLKAAVQGAKSRQPVHFYQGTHVLFILLYFWFLCLLIKWHCFVVNTYIVVHYNAVDWSFILNSNASPGFRSSCLQKYPVHLLSHLTVCQLLPKNITQ